MFIEVKKDQYSITPAAEYSDCRPQWEECNFGWPKLKAHFRNERECICSIVIEVPTSIYMYRKKHLSNKQFLEKINLKISDFKTALSDVLLIFKGQITLPLLRSNFFNIRESKEDGNAIFCYKFREGIKRFLVSIRSTNKAHTGLAKKINDSLVTKEEIIKALEMNIEMFDIWYDAKE